MNKQQIQNLCKALTLDCMGIEFEILVEYDKKYTKVFKAYDIVNGVLVEDKTQEPFYDGRIYIQLQYKAPCTKTGEYGIWKSAKHSLSSHMTEDEVVKTVYKAFRLAVEHEIMEGFKFNGQIVFNPHTSFRDLLTVSNKEVTRNNNEQSNN